MRKESGRTAGSGGTARRRRSPGAAANVAVTPGPCCTYALVGLSINSFEGEAFVHRPALRCQVTEGRRRRERGAGRGRGWMLWYS